jgi:thioesterase domain-containing protein
MLERREHKRVLSGLRETRGRQLEGHRAELEQERAAWRRAREARPAMHRAVLDGARAELQRARRMHRTMLAQNRWLLVLAERVQQRLKKAG